MSKGWVRLILANLLVLVLVFGLAGSVLASGPANPNAAARKIVVFQIGVNEPAKAALLQQFGGVLDKTLPLLGNANVVHLPPSAEAALSLNTEVVRVRDDVQLKLIEPLAKPGGGGGSTQPPQTLPWGVDHIDADLAWPITTADPIKVAILDTGISTSHPDLKDNIKGGYNAINALKSPEDRNGHGSHVAGIVAGINNSIGVVGVGHKADLYAVQVLGASGSGWLSDIIDGLYWSIDNGMQVVNMSFGSTVDDADLYTAIKAANNAGIVLIAAAGNEGSADNTVLYPAKYPEVIAVAAVASDGTQPYWSSRGPEVDLAAPGVSIYSTYKGTGYATLSGTSMAAPHVTGTAALVLATAVGTYDTNGNGKWDPAEVKAKLEGTAELLAGLNDNQQGSGLVDAGMAIAGVH
jgi:subtilisin family serine protease